MPHPLLLPSDIGSQLWQPELHPLTVRVWFTGRSRIQTGSDPGGGPIFSGAYYNVADFDLGPRRSADDRLRISLSKPVIPGIGDEVNASEIQIGLINTDHAIATVQGGAILDPAAIESGRIGIEVEFPGTSQILQYYSGRITGHPEESAGQTTLSVRDAMWEIIKRPVLFEDIGQDTYVNGGSLFNNPYTVNIGNSLMSLYDGYVLWNEAAELITTVTNTSNGAINLTNIGIATGAKLGKYTLEFIDPVAFRVTYPDSQIFTGNRNQNFTSQHITIDSAWWLGTAEPGVKIEWQVYWTASGNPVTLAINLLIKGWLQNYGSIPAINAPPASMPIKWASFKLAEAVFADYKVFVSETNKSNDVWKRVAGSRPLSYLNLAQKILSHVGCTIGIDLAGELVCQHPFLFDETIYELTDESAIISHSVKPEKKYNYLRWQYGYNDQASNFGVEAPATDLRYDPDSEPEEFVSSFPYYKSAVSFEEMESIKDIYRRRFFNQQIFINAKVTPSFGLAAMPGDHYRLKTTTQPILNKWVEVVEVSKGINDDGDLVMIEVQDPEGPAPKFCAYKLCAPMVY